MTSRLEAGIRSGCDRSGPSAPIDTEYPTTAGYSE